MKDTGYWQQKRIGRRKVLGAAGAGGLAVGAALAVGCGDDDDDGGPSTSTGPSTGQPKRGGALVHSSVTVIPNLDPHGVATQNLHSLGPGVAYSRLLYLDVGKDGLPASNAIPRADLAEKWEQVDDLTYVFQLRKGVKYFNIAPVNGREWKADDVVYSFGRQRDLKANASFLDPLERVEAVDPYTIRVRLSRPDTDFLVNMTEPHNKVDVPRELVEKNGDLKEPPVIGTGAFMFDEKAWVRGQFIKMPRNPDYWNKERPYFDSLDQHIITDRSTYLAALRTKRIITTGLTASNNLTKQEATQLKRELPDFDILERPSLAAGNVWAHWQKEPTKDPRVRQAISKAIDRNIIIQTALQGAGWWTVGVKVPNRDALLPEDEVKRLLGRDVAGARALLQQAGVSNWSPRMTVQATSPNQEVGELVQANLRDVGINARIELVSTQQYTEVVRGRGEFDLHVGGDQLGASTNQDLQIRYATGGNLNGPRMSDPELDRLIQQQAAERDRNKRNEILKQIQRRIVEVSGNIPTAGGYRIMGNWNFVKDFEPTFGIDFYEYYNVQTGWLDQ